MRVVRIVPILVRCMSAMTVLIALLTNSVVENAGVSAFSPPSAHSVSRLSLRVEKAKSGLSSSPCVLRPSSKATTATFPQRRQSSTRRYNFLKNMLDQAFENDRSLSSDKSKGSYDDIFKGEEYVDNSASSVNGGGGSTTLTETQKKWRQLQETSNAVTPELIATTSATFNLYLSGIPAKDPSNDLYASKVNISSRDKTTGLTNLPSEPTCPLQVTFLENGVCTVDQATAFCAGDTDGEWKLVRDDTTDTTILRFSVDVLGFQRTVTTKGSIQKVAWSNAEEVSTSTSSTYSVPPGWVYCDIGVVPKTNKSGGDRTFEFAPEGGVLRVEQKMGLLGAASKLVACGKFSVASSKPDSL